MMYKNETSLQAVSLCIHNGHIYFFIVISAWIRLYLPVYFLSLLHITIMFTSRVMFLAKTAARVTRPAAFFRPAITRSLVTIEEAKKMVRNYNDMPNEVLLNMAIMGDQDAREERVIREVMAVENVTWSVLA